MKNITFSIEGMSCDACVGHVTKALTGLEGVEEARVSLPENQAIVIYDPFQVTEAAMIAAVENEGYGAARGG